MRRRGRAQPFAQVRLRRPLGAVEAFERAPWRDGAIAVLEEPDHDLPVDLAIESDTDPAARSDVGRNEEQVGIGLDQPLLAVGVGFDPGGDTSVAVMVVVKTRKGLLATPERGRPMGDSFFGFRPRRDDAAQPIERLSGSGQDRILD